jgi:hypothetical protein
MSDETIESEAKGRCHSGNGHNNGHNNANGAERRFAAIERDVAVIASNYCTKEDLVKVELKMLDRFGRLDATLAEMESRVVRWVFASVVSVAAVCFTAGKLL